MEKNTDSDKVICFFFFGSVLSRRKTKVFLYLHEVIVETSDELSWVGVLGTCNVFLNLS